MPANTFANNNSNHRYAIYISLILLLSIFIFKAVVFKSASDDSDFIRMLDGKTLSDVLSNRYVTWSGRVLIEAILIKSIGIKFFPQVMIVLCSWLLSYSLVKISRIETQSLLMPIATLLLVCFATHSSNQAVFWITGAYNYLLPISLGLYAFSIYLENKQNSPKLVFAGILTIFACNNEQFGVSLSLVVIAIIVIKCRIKNLMSRDLIYLSAVLLGTAIVLAAPGNVQRAITESLTNMPFYSDMNIVDRFSIAVDRINGHLLYKNNYLFIVCCIYSIFTMLRSNSALAVRFPIILLSFAYVCFFIFHEYPNDWFTKVLNPNYSIFSDWSKPGIFISFVFTLALLVSFYISCIDDVKESNHLAFLIITFTIGLLSVAMIGFSPTAYASGTRIMFIFDLTLIIGLLKTISIPQ